MQEFEHIGTSFREFCESKNIAAAVSCVILENGAVMILTYPNTPRVHPMTYIGLSTHLLEKVKGIMIQP